MAETIEREGIRFVTENPLEKYRAESLLTKEPETVEWIRTFFRDGETFFDVGANVGMYSLFAGKIHPGLKVYSFEPFWKNYRRLCENILANSLNNVVPVFCALSDRVGIDVYNIKDERSGASGGQVGRSTDEFGRGFEVLAEETVLVYSIDRFVEIFQVSPPEHLKIDVDGLEDEIIFGATNCLVEKKIKSMLVEVNFDAPGESALARELNRLGYFADHEINRMQDHSRVRRAEKVENRAENLIFTPSGR
ncbi:MAG: FkbM family methyltransferase [Longimicrobiales bacterium]